MTRRTGYIGLSFIVYIIVMITLYSSWGNNVTTFLVIPVAIAAVTWGIWPGLLIAFLAILLNQVLYAALDIDFNTFGRSNIPRLISFFFVAGLAGYVRDLQVHYREEAKRRQALEEEVREREALYLQLFHSSFEAIVIHRAGILIEVNEQFAKQFGFSRSELIGSQAINYAARDSREEIINRIREQNEKPFEAIGLRKDGTTFPMELQTKLIIYHGRPALFSALRDLSLRKEAEALLVQKEKLRLVKDVVGNVSHDLRTPLTVMGNYLYFLNYSDDPERRAKALSILNAQTQHLNRLIEALISMSRLDQNAVTSFSMVDVNELIKLVTNHFSYMATDRGIVLQSVLDSELGDIVAIESELYRALTNLVENALNHTNPDGSVTLRTVKTAQDQVIITIEDTGEGIPAEDIPNIFDRFYRVDTARGIADGRTGMGLAIVKRVAERHNGQITVQSTPGQGSTFSIILPRIQPDV